MSEDKVIYFRGSLAVEGDMSKLDMDALKEYLERAVCLDLDIESGGQLSDDVEVTGIGIDWESLTEGQLRCRYSDCIEGHPVAGDEEQVTCETCRKTLGLPPLTEPSV